MFTKNGPEEQNMPRKKCCNKYKKKGKHCGKCPFLKKKQKKRKKKKIKEKKKG